MASKLSFTERQASAILEMRLYKLIGLEIEALMKEHRETLDNIAKYENILNNRKVMSKVIIKELDAVKKEFGTDRKTRIENAKEAVYEEEKIAEQQVVFMMDRFGYVKTIDTSVYERNKETIGGESRYVIPCMNTDKICVFTNTGKLHLIKVMDIPYGKLRDKGTPIDNLGNYDSREEEVIFLQAMVNVRASRILYATRLGMVKLVEGEEFDVVKRTVAATKLQEDDLVIFAGMAGENEDIIMQTESGVHLRFRTDEIPLKKKTAVGVRGIRLDSGDTVGNVYLIGQKEEKSIIFKQKEILLHRLKQGKRDTRGVKTRLS